MHQGQLPALLFRSQLRLGGANGERLEIPFRLRETESAKMSREIAAQTSALSAGKGLGKQGVNASIASPELGSASGEYSVIADRKVKVRDLRAALSAQLRVPRQFISIYSQDVEITNNQPVNLA